METETRDLSKLPKWARDTITRLQREHDAMEQQLAEATAAAGYATQDDTARIVGRITPTSPHATVRWPIRGVVHDGAAVDVSMDEEGTLTVRSLHEGLSVRPVAANTIRVNLTPL